MTYSLKLEGLGDLKRLLDPAQLQRALAAGIKAVGAELERQVKERTPVVTGILRGSIKVRVSGTEAVVAAEAGEFQRAGVYYAPHVEHGTRPHEIRPVRKKALAWPQKEARTAAGLGGGPRGTKVGTTWKQFAHATRVQHPGTKGQFMFKRGLEEETQRYLGILQAEIRRALGK